MCHSKFYHHSPAHHRPCFSYIELAKTYSNYLAQQLNLYLRLEEERKTKDSLKVQIDALDERSFSVQNPGYVDMVNSVDFALRSLQITVVSGCGVNRAKASYATTLAMTRTE